MHVELCHRSFRPLRPRSKLSGLLTLLFALWFDDVWGRMRCRSSLDHGRARSPLPRFG